MRQFKIIWLLLFLFSFSCNNTNSGKANDGDNAINKINKADITLRADTTLIGKVLPKWGKGYLDIAAINTGRGESTFFILPDGTTLLVDGAGSTISLTNTYPPPPQKPNPNVSPGQAIVDYIKHYMPKNNDKLDYMLLSHFHGDHMGGYSKDLPTAPDGNFKMSGLTEIGAKIPVGKIIDRGYPNYDYPVDMKKKDEVANYIKFIDWAKKTYNSKAEQFDVGSMDQIVLNKEPSKYANFEIRNIVANGKVWTGKGTKSVSTFPDDLSELNAAHPNENIFSDGFHLSYGKFDYFTAGDLQYDGRAIYPWKDIETSVSKVMGPVDVMKADHHGTSCTNDEALLNKLRPQAVIINVWRNVQPNPETIDRLFLINDSCNIFLTNLSTDNKNRLRDYVPRLRSMHGHIVVRVAPGGSEYTIYVLDDTNQNYIIKNVFGPYQSK